MQVPTAEQYCHQALEMARTAVQTQLPSVQQAATLVADAIANDHLFWAFGTGHSHLLVEELWGRAGGMTAVHPILEPGLMLHEGLQKSSGLERLPGLAEVLIREHPVGDGDCLLMVSNSGRNAVPVEFAALARDRGATVIALTSQRHSESVDSRAPGGQRLFEMADVVIDNCGVPGDALLDSPGGRLGPTSTFIGTLLVQALATETIGLLQSRGFPVELLVSNNV